MFIFYFVVFVFVFKDGCFMKKKYEKSFFDAFQMLFQFGFKSNKNYPHLNCFPLQHSCKEPILLLNEKKNSHLGKNLIIKKKSWIYFILSVLETRYVETCYVKVGILYLVK